MRSLLFVILCALGASATVLKEASCLCCGVGASPVTTHSRCFDYGYATAVDGQCLSNKGGIACCADLADLHRTNCLDACRHDLACDERCRTSWRIEIGICTNGGFLESSVQNCMFGQNREQAICCSECLGEEANSCFGRCNEGNIACLNAGQSWQFCASLFGDACNGHCAAPLLKCVYECTGAPCPGV